MLAAMHLVGSEHVQGGQRMDGVVPVVELREVRDGFGRVGEAVRIGGMGLDGTEVGFDTRVVIRLTGAAEELGDPQLLEVLAGRVGPHLRATIAEAGGPPLGRVGG